MTSHGPSPSSLKRHRMRRALLKIAVLLIFGLALCAAFVVSLDDTMLATIKHSLSMWSVLVLVVAINMVSAAILLALYMAWCWVRCDLKNESESGNDSDS
ncbi:hypothetical protein MICA_2374 [Micavibrio aeruginosavorus ARL-13]|uniref:Uncharacterized protein n=1 Tax=Micavibrio aeruginosavorus (strain ARL-13) TaxID=856793 RepID=G2KMI3_MICAA|nr:hypothetical protein MICA_2374 [Micavibrio aeruginosavorus ARL-13]